MTTPPKTLAVVPADERRGIDLVTTISPSRYRSPFTSLLQSDMVKIILRNPECSGLVASRPQPVTSHSIKSDKEDHKDSTKDNNEDDNNKATAASNNRPFYVHKDILANLSTELYKHVYNDMSEGLQGVIHLSEVDAPTMETFLEWAYRGVYSVGPLNPYPALLPHTKLYVFADRFNIVPLKHLSYTHLTTLLRRHIGSLHPTGMDEISHVLDTVRFAFDNLPTSTLFTQLSDPEVPSCWTCSNGEEGREGGGGRGEGGGGEESHQLLRYLAEYLSYSLDAVKYHPDFGLLLDDVPDLAKALVYCSCEAEYPPWEIANPTPYGSTQSLCCSPGTLITSVTLPHVLKRKCNRCGWIGVATPRCRYCLAKDHEVGLEIMIDGVVVGVLGEGRSYGTNEAPMNRCRWCGNASPYRAGSMFQEYLFCRKCDAEGGELEVVD